MTKRRFRWTGTCAAMCAPLLTGCPTSTTTNGDGGAVDAGIEDGARLRILHLSQSTGAIDVLTSDDTFVEDLVYGESSVAIETAPGRYSFFLTAAGSSREEAALTISDVDVAANSESTVFAFDGPALSAGRIIEDRADIDEGKVRLRFVHVATNVGAVRIVDLTPTLDGGAAVALYDEVELGEIGDAIDVPSGRYNLGIDVIGQGAPESIELYFNVDTGTDNELLHLFAAEDPAGSVYLLVQGAGDDTTRIDAASPPALRFVHAAPTAGAVDVFVGQQPAPAVSDLSFGESSRYVLFSPGQTDLALTSTGAARDTALLWQQAVRLEPGSLQTAYAYSKADGSTGGGLLSDDTTGLEEDAIRIRAVHIATGVGRVDFWALPTAIASAPVRVAEEIGFGEAQGPVDLSAQQIQLGIDVNGDGRPNALFTLPEFGGGTLVHLFVTRNESGDLTLLIQPSSTRLREDTILPSDLERAELRVLHMADLGSVDVFVDQDSSPAFTGLSFGEVTPYASQLAGARSYDIVATGGGRAESLLSLSPALESGSSYTAIAIGQTEPTSVRGLIISDDPPSLSGTESAVRIVHGAAGIGSVDVYEASTLDSPLLTALRYGDFSEQVTLPSAAYTVVLDLDGVPGNSDDLRFALPTLPSGVGTTVVATRDYEEAEAPVFLAVLGSGTAVVRVDPLP
ncbi:MAG: DUF4397 domain-containing protein [Myxococcota bacterium]